MRTFLAWAWMYPGRTFGLCLLLGFVVLNLLAYRHARAFTRFRAGGEGPGGAPQSLSLLGKVRLLLGGVTLPRPCPDRTPAGAGLPFEHHCFPGEAGTLEAWHVPHRAARGLVLLFHGYGNCKAGLLPEAQAFHELGYACLLVDFRGSGGSEGDATTIGYAEADDVARAAAFARQKWPSAPLILYGQSMGSAAILRALSAGGVTADAAVLECPFDRLLTTVKARFATLGVPSFPGAQLLVFWGGWQHRFNGFRHNPVDYARAVSCPVLLLHGRQDPRVSAGQIEEVYANLAGAKELHSFDDLAHESYVAKRPQEWKERVARFLDRHGAGR
jgi:alpha-beta hydrolase superfamily lysophospholipase